MTPARRGRRVVAWLLVAVALVVLLGVARWQDIARRYLAYQAMEDPRTLLAYSREPAGSLKHLAVR